MGTLCGRLHPKVPGVLDPRFCSLCGQPLERRLLKANEPERYVCTGCGEVSWCDPKLAVATLIEWEGGLLLLRRANQPGYGRWTIPGGFVDRGESTEYAAIREAREEVCVEVGSLALVGVFSYVGHPVVLIAYEARVSSGTPAVGDEALEIGVYPFDRIPRDELAFPSTHDAIDSYVRWRADRFVRT